MRSDLGEAVGQLMRETAAAVILPRFGALAAGEVHEKSPGEVVTVADREAETLLASGLAALLPGAAVVGEEAASADPRLLEALGGDGPVWLVDPLDGTANFEAGDPRFAVMVALIVDGETVASWMLDPLRDCFAVAERSAGATIDGVPVRAPTDVPPLAALKGAVLTRFLPPDLRAEVAARGTRLGRILPGMRCAGTEYPAIAAGTQHFALFWRALAWDHAPGVLFLTEAGGHAARLDGAPYRPADPRPGLLVAQNEGVWEAVREVLLGGYE